MNFVSINLKNLRLKRGISQAQVAKALNLGERVMSNYENERTPGIDILSDLADFYGVTVDYLIHENPDTMACKEDIKRLYKNNIEQDLKTFIEQTEIWKRYKRLSEKNDSDKTCEDEFTYILEDLAKEARVEAAKDMAINGDYNCARDELETLLAEGWLGALTPLLFVSTKIDEGNATGYDTYALALKAEMDYIQKIVTYGAVAYHEVMKKIDSMYTEIMP